MANRKKKHTAKRIGFILLTLFLVGLTTAAICLGAFVVYINVVIKPEAELDINSLSMKFNSVIYYQDDSGQEQVLQKLGDYYAFERRGIRLIRMEDSYQLCSSPDYADVIRKAFEIRKPAKLSQPALEVLTIIAYYQPTTRAYVDQIRGVDSSYTVGLLLDRHLIEECGRLQVPGRPRLYRTTQAFLRAFHLNSLEELPQLPGMEADGQLRLDDDTVPADGENGAEAL